MTLNDLEWRFYVKFHYYEQLFEKLFLTYFVCFHRVTSGDVRKRKVIRRTFGIHGKTCGSLVDATLSELLTNKANIGI